MPTALKNPPLGTVERPRIEDPLSNSRVVTLTPAPAIDRVYFLNRMVEGHVNRAHKVEAYFAGKGINVARTLRLAGNTASAVVPVPGDFAPQAEDWGHGGPQLFHRVRIGAATRVNTIVVDTDGSTTNFNESPPPLAPQQWEELCRAAIDEAVGMEADWLVLGGTLPTAEDTGLEVNPAALFRTAHSLGIRTCLDTSANALKNWAPSAGPVDLIKPNRQELTELTGLPVRTLKDAVLAANALRAKGVRTVLASLGREGLLEVGANGALWARGPRVPVVNTTGAGDAALAGYLSALPHAGVGPYNQAVIREALARAVAWGALAVQQATTILPRVATAPSGITVSSPDMDHVLSG